MLRPVDGCTLIEQTDIVLNESKNVINTCPQTCRRRAPRSISRPTPLGKASGRPWRRTCKTRRPLPSRRRTCAREAAAQQANQSECAPASPPRVVGDDGGFGFSGIHLLVELIVARVAVTGLVGGREARIVRRRSDLCARANALAHEAHVVASSRWVPNGRRELTFTSISSSSSSSSSSSAPSA